VIDTWLYDAWGNVMSHTGPTIFPFQFVGRFGYFTDPDTDTVWIMIRPYQPVIARWWRQEPLRFVDGINLYVYVGNLVVNAVDPTGLFGCNRTSALLVVIGDA